MSFVLDTIDDAAWQLIHADYFWIGTYLLVLSAWLETTFDA